MELYSNMEFEMKSTFTPNISHSNILKILEVNAENVVIQMRNSNCRGVFPLDNFHYWIKKNSLVQINEEVEKTS
ncbi:MAG: hypothetical protein Q8934_21310 [Bacillota bacterium]|nr:hypothetical protein [Bacillota bacterium]